MTDKIKAITKGSQIIDQIFWELLKLLSARGGKTTPGLTERDLARQIRKLAKNLGAGSMAFPPIVSFGSNSAEIHHKPKDRKIGRNNFLMLDYGIKVNGYCSDFTRTLFLGSPNRFQKKIYNIVLKAQLAAIKKVRVTAISSTVDKSARSVIAKAGFGKYFTHGTGHGVGKKIHMLPSFKPDQKDVVTKNSVVTVEPGIYLPRKFGVRIEDMILVANKTKVFSKIPKDFASMTI